MRELQGLTPWNGSKLPDSSNGASRLLENIRFEANLHLLLYLYVNNSMNRAKMRIKYNRLKFILFYFFQIEMMTMRK